MASDTKPDEPRRNDSTGLLQLALAGAVLILLGLAASQARRDDPARDDGVLLPVTVDSTGYDFDDPLPYDADEPAGTSPVDIPSAQDSVLPDPPVFVPGAAP